MKQTAIEWLVEQFNEIHTQRKWKEITDQAKEMEKQQIIDAYSEGDINGIMNAEKRAEQYYNETFKK